MKIHFKQVFIALLLFPVIVFASALSHPPDLAQQVTAIDVLEPDATMLQHAATNNARLLQSFPKGFHLDALRWAIGGWPTFDRTTT